MLKTLSNNKTQHIYHNDSANQQKQKEKTVKTRNVWQDKVALRSDRFASPQPELVTNGVQPRALDSKTHRSQNRSPAREKLVPRTLHLRPLVLAEFERIAERENVSVSSVGATACEEWVRYNIPRQQASLLRTELQQINREELQAFGRRIVFFLMRIAFSAEQARILITNVLQVILQTRGDFDQKTYFTMVDGSAKLARKNIIRNTPQMKSLLEEWERAFANGEGEGKPR